MTLAELKEGDQVTLMSYSEKPVAIKTIGQASLKFIVIEGQRYRREGGKKVASDRFSQSYVTPCLPWHIAYLRAEGLRAKLSHCDFAGVPLDKLEAVAAILWPTAAQNSGDCQ